MFPNPIPDQTITVFATPRPMRIAVVIDADSETAVDDFEQIANYFTNLWGGRYNAVVLSRGGEIHGGWRRLLEVVDPDCIYSVIPLTESTVEWVNTRCCPAIFRNGDRVARRADEQLNVFGMLSEVPARIATLPAAIASRTNTLFTPKFYYIHGVTGDDPYRRFIGQNFGILSDEVSIKDAFRGTEYVEHNLREIEPHVVFTDLSGQGTFSRFTPDMLAASHAHPVAGNGGMYEHCFTIVVGDTIDDLALFRAVKMLEDSTGGRHCAWLPASLATNDNAIALVRTWIINSYWTGGNTKQAQVVSRSMPEAELQPLAEKLSEDWQLSVRIGEVPNDDFGLPTPVEIFIPTAMRQVWIAPIRMRLTKAYQCGIVGGDGVLDVQFPEFLQSVGNQEQIMIDLEIPYQQNEESSLIVRSGSPQVWRLPQRQGLAHAFLPGNRLSRIERRGLPSGVLTRDLDLFSIRIPSPSIMFHCCMSNDFISEHEVAGRRTRRFIKWRSSDEGQFLAALIRLFGTPYACGHTLAKPFWGPMLRELVLGPNVVADITPKSAKWALTVLAEQEGAVDITTDAGRDKATDYLIRHARASSRKTKGYSKEKLIQAFARFQNSAPNEHWYWNGASWKNRDLDHDLNNYVEADVLRMGIQFQCEQCLTDQWVSVNSITIEIECSGCGARRPLGAEPTWRYQVNTLAAEAIRRRGVIAVVQALYAVEHAAQSESFVALPSIDVYEGESKQPFTDLDLVYFVNREFVIGEVKADPTGFKKADLTKLRDVAVDIRPNRVVIAAPEGDWPPAIEELFHQLAAEQESLGVIWELKKLRWQP